MPYHKYMCEWALKTIVIFYTFDQVCKFYYLNSFMFLFLSVGSAAQAKDWFKIPSEISHRCGLGAP